MQKRHRLLAKLGVVFSVIALAFEPQSARAENVTLERAIQLARARSLVVHEAEGELGVAHSQMAGARASAIGNPYSDIQVDRGWDGTPGTGNVQALSYTYIPIDIAGQRGKRIDEAETLIAWRKNGVADARAIATGAVVAAYGGVVVSSARVSAAVTGEQNARDEAKYFAGRLEAKDTTVYEKSLADAEVARWVQSRAEAALHLAAARATFSQLTGLPVTEGPPQAASALPPPLHASWDDAHIARVVDRAPIIARLKAERTFWDASAARYRRERIPPISFEIIAGRGGAGEARFGAGAVLTFPITRRYQGEIARAEFGEQHASEHLTLYRSIIDNRLRAAHEALEAVVKAVDELDKTGIIALERAAAASQDAYKLGKIELQRVLLAKRDLAVAVARRLDLLEAGWRAYADLVILSGDLP